MPSLCKLKHQKSLFLGLWIPFPQSARPPGPPAALFFSAAQIGVRCVLSLWESLGLGLGLNQDLFLKKATICAAEKNDAPPPPPRPIYAPLALLVSLYALMDSWLLSHIAVGKLGRSAYIISVLLISTEITSYRHELKTNQLVAIIMGSGDFLTAC